MHALKKGDYWDKTDGIFFKKIIEEKKLNNSRICSLFMLTSLPNGVFNAEAT